MTVARIEDENKTSSVLTSSMSSEEKDETNDVSITNTSNQESGVSSASEGMNTDGSINMNTDDRTNHYKNYCQDKTRKEDDTPSVKLPDRDGNCIERTTKVYEDFKCSEPDDPEDEIGDYENLDSDEDESINDDDIEGDDKVTYISVYTGKAVEKPPSPPSPPPTETAPAETATPPTETTLTTTTPATTPATSKALREDAVSSSSPSLSSSVSVQNFFALRQGRYTSGCIYLRKDKLKEQTEGYPLAKYESFDTMDKAVEYLTSDPMFIITSTEKSKRVYVVDDKSNNQNSTINSTPTRNPRFQESWENMFLQLMHFQRLNGNIDVPANLKYSFLSSWVQEQRTNFQKYASGSTSDLTEGKVRLLCGLDFNFFAKNAPKKSFDDYCQELVDYRARNHNTDPLSGSVLDDWIQNMRREYESFVNDTNKTVQLDLKNKQSLELIGFKWTKKPNEYCKKFGKRFVAKPIQPTGMTVSPNVWGAPSTTAAITKNNNTGVFPFPQTNGYSQFMPRIPPVHFTPQSFAARVSAARTMFPMMSPTQPYILPKHNTSNLKQKTIPINEKKHPGNPSTRVVTTSTYEQYEPKKLSNYHPPDGIREKKWNSSFEALKEFKEKNGHLNIDDNSDLGRWCTIQRKRYKKSKNGQNKTGSFTEEKIQKLKDIGFQFELLNFTNKSAQNFYSKIEELKKFKYEHGHFEVPTKGKLYSWLVDLKSVHRKYEEKKKEASFIANQWTEMKLKKLKEIGFDFNSKRKSDGRMTSNKKKVPLTDTEKVEEQEKWNEMYNEMKAFKEKNGHCLPPSKPWTTLRSWMEKQRSEYKRMVMGEPSEMTGLRVRYLNEIQFPFTSTRVKVPWDERFEELKRFKAKYGNCSVPRGYQGKLGIWVQNQRSKYKDARAGRKSTLTEERIKKLEDLGMVWSILPTPVVTERKSWDERFEDLLKYKEEHGHTRVPQSYPGLGNWVHAQRVGYHLMKKGRSTRLSTEKALKLAEMGFEFVVAPRKQRPSRQDLYNPHPHLTRRMAEESERNNNSLENDQEYEHENEGEESNAHWLSDPLNDL